MVQDSREASVVLLEEMLDCVGSLWDLVEETLDSVGFLWALVKDMLRCV